MTNHNSPRAIFLALLVFCLHTFAFGQSTKNAARIAIATADQNQLRWELRVPYSGAILTVSGPGGRIIHQEFEAGVLPSLGFAGLPEGRYNYELRLLPTLAQEVREALAAARRRGDDAVIEQELRAAGKLPQESLVQVGSFSIEKGLVFVNRSDDAAEPEPGRQLGARLGVKRGRTLAPNDVVTPDDAIIQGSLCVGLDCVDNESFGFDTIRLKENNTRIKFDDTSVAAGFPANDWQLTANDSASGGASKFSIDDVTGAKTPFTVTAGAPTGSIFVDSTGRVGLRTTTPALDVHLLTGNTPAFRLDQDGSGGFTPQVWDIAGNEANFFVRDVTGGSRLPFRIRPGAPTSSIDIAASGNVGIGTASPTSKLTVNGVVEIKDPGSALPFGLQFPGGLIQNTLGAGDSLHIMGSTGAVDEDSTGIVELANFVVGVKAASTGTVNIRFNLPSTPNLSAIGSTFRAFKIRYRDGDGAGTSAQVVLTVHSTDIATGGNTTVFTFDSNAEPPAGLAFTTATKCDNTAGTDFDFSTKGYWIEASITKSVPADFANLAHIQIFKTTSCP